MSYVSHKQGKYPLFNYSYISGVEDSECYVVELTLPQIKFLQSCIGSGDTPFTSYRSRWYTDKKGDNYLPVDDDTHKLYIKPLIEDVRGRLANKMCLNTNLENISSHLEQLVALKTEELSHLKSQTLSFTDMIQKTQESEKTDLNGALDTMLKIQELFGLIPDWDLQLKPVDLYTMITTARRHSIQKKALDRATKYLGIMATSQGGSDAIAFAETIWETLPLTDVFDEFSEIPENAIDLGRLISAFFEKTQIDAMDGVANAIRECCLKEEEGKTSVVGLNYYPDIDGQGHSRFCEQLASIVGRAKALLDNIQSSVLNNYPIGTTTNSKVINAIKVVYGIDVNSGGSGISKLVELAEVPLTLGGFNQVFTSSIQGIMSNTNCKGSPSEFIGIIEEYMGISYSQFFDAFLILLPPSDVIRVFSGTFPVNTAYAYTYSSGCGCTESSPSQYPVIDCFDDNGQGRAVRVGSVYPYESQDLDDDNGYYFNGFYLNEIMFTASRVVSFTESLSLFIGINPFTIFSPPYPILTITMECGGVGISIGTMEITATTTNKTFTGISVPNTGVPTVKLHWGDSGSFYIGSVILTNVGG